MKLTKGNKYDISTLTCTGWTEGDGSGHEGYNVADYFRDGVYLGADEHGIEPLFADYSEYAVHIVADPKFYGSDCTQADADGIAKKLASMVERKFAGISTQIRAVGGHSSEATGPKLDVVDEINAWIESNWTAAV